MGYQLGEVPQLGTLSFPADEKMAALAKSVCEKVNTEIKVFSGRIVSGDQFISDKADNSAEMDYPAFEREAAKHCANLVEEFIVEL